MKLNRAHILLNTTFVIVFILSACSKPIASPTSVQTSAITVIPSVTPTVTSTIALPSPTVTSLPTSTPAPTATPTPAPTPQGGGGKLVLTLFKSAYASQFTLEGEANVFVLNPDGSGMKPLTNGPKDMENLAAAVSPDGNLIAYSQVKINLRYFYSDNTLGDLFIIRADGTGPIQLTTPKLKAYWRGVTWLPDNRLLFFGSDEKGTSIFLADPKTGTVSRMKSPSGDPRGLIKVLGISPDGSGIYWFAGKYCPEHGLCNERYFWSRLDDTEHRQIWKNIEYAADRIQISPDGKRIAYFGFLTSFPSSVNGCFTANIDGTGITRAEGARPMCVSFNGSRNSSWWSSDSTRIIYEDYDKAREKLYYKMWSAVDGKSTVLPDLKTGACDDITWLPGDQQVLFFNCQSNTWGNSIPSPMRILDLSSGQVTTLADTGFCNMRFSPDRQQAIFYNCDQNKADKPLTYKIFSLDNHPIQDGLASIFVPFSIGSAYNQEFGYAHDMGQAFWIPAP